MITTFFEAPKVKINRSNTLYGNLGTSNRYGGKFKALTSPGVSRQHSLVHSICVFISREIADSLEYWADKKWISDTAITYFSNKANGDVDFLENIYRKNGKMDSFSADFETVTTFFKVLSERSLSEFQRESDSELANMLQVIYGITFVDRTASFLAWSVGKLRDDAVISKVLKKRDEVKKVFLERYSEVSNSREFDFDQFNGLFDKVKKMTHDEFSACLDDLR